MKPAAKRSVLPYYGVAVLWVGYALARPLYTIPSFLLVGILSLGLFLLLRAVCPDQAAPQAEEKAAEETPAEEKKPEATGNAELDKAIREGELAVREMRRLNDSITDERLSAAIDQLERLSGKIFEAVRQSPEKLPQIRKFMDYYLPTTLKLLNAYDRMAATGVSGENIDGTKAKVEEMMDTIVTAFARQLDSLYGDEALDISTDITVLETMLAREGLAGDRMEAEASGNAQDGGIDLKL